MYGRVFQTPLTDRTRHDVGIHTMAVGSISSCTDVNTIIGTARADLCLLARARPADAYWTRHAAFVQQYPLPWPDPCGFIERCQPRLEFRL